MRLIDADAIVTENPDVLEVLKNAPTVENAVVLPFQPGGYLWFVDDEDGYKVKEYDGEGDKIDAVAYFGGNTFKVVHSGGMFIPGEAYICTSKEEAEALREELLSDMTLKQMCECVNWSNKTSPDEWEDFVADFKKRFLEQIKNVHKCP